MISATETHHATANQREGSAKTRPLELAGLTAVYTIVWLATRWPAIAANPLFFDDYGLPKGPAGFYVGSYRPLLLAEYAFWEALVPGHFWTALPKVTSALYIALASTALARLIEGLGVQRLLAISAPIVVLCNPVLADATLWQSSHALALALFLVVASHLAWLHGRFWLAATLLVAGLLGYQIYIGLALVLLAADVALRRPRLADVIWHGGLIAAAGAVQVAVMLLTRLALPQSDPRGFAAIDSLSAFVRQKWHGSFDLTVNGVMPVLAWYAGGLAAMSLWKWVPIALGAATAVATRRFTPSLIATVLLFVPSLPVLAISQSPYAWRVSAPVAFALALALVIPLARLSEVRAAASVCMVIAAVMAPVSWYEASSRTQGHRRQESILAAIRADAGGVAQMHHTVAWVPPTERGEDPRYRGPHDLTWGYDVRTPSMWTSFADEWMARTFVESRGLRFRLASPHEKALCTRNCSDIDLPSPRVMRLGSGTTTLVCAEVLAELPVKCPAQQPSPTFSHVTQ